MLADLLPWKSRLHFVGPRLQPEAPEWERESISEVHYRPLYWSGDAPEPRGKPRNYYARIPGATEYWLIRVDPDYDYSDINLEWFGPLPEPYELPGPRWGP